MRNLSKFAALIPCWLWTPFVLADTLAFGEGEFDVANLEIELFNFHTGGNANAIQVVEGGNPDAYLRVTHMTNDATNPQDNAAIYVFHGLPAATVDPAVNGAITAVDFSWDVRALEDGLGGGGFFGPALRQGDRYYVSAGNLELVGEDQTWRPVKRQGLTAQHFGRIQDILEIDPDDDPDFSASGEPIVFGFFSALAGAIGGQGLSQSDGYDNWQVVVETESVRECPEFNINAGLNDAWYNAATSGQGFFINVFPGLGLMFMAWFTYDSERPDEGLMANPGEPGHRWLTAFGEYAGNSAVLNVELTFGGEFNSVVPVPKQSPDYGTVSIKFCDCNNATLTYDLPSSELAGQIDITRVVDDNVALCEMLNTEQ